MEAGEQRANRQGKLGSGACALEPNSKRLRRCDFSNRRGFRGTPITIDLHKRTANLRAG
jgi:hypothetical protein